MKVPKKIKIGPHTFKVKVGKEARRLLVVDGSRGDSVPDDHVIRVDIVRPHTGVAETLLHEVFHCILDQVLRNWNKFSDDDEEFVVTVLSPLTLQVLRDNPELVKFLMKEGK